MYSNISPQKHINRRENTKTQKNKGANIRKSAPLFTLICTMRDFKRKSPLHQLLLIARLIGIEETSNLLRGSLLKLILLLDNLGDAREAINL